MMLLCLSIILGNLIDYGTTRLALQRGAVEQNPLVRFSPLRAKLIITILQCVFSLWIFPAELTRVISLGFIGTYLAIGIWNISVWRRAQNRS